MNCPEPWQLREHPDHPGHVYYYNTSTHETSWIRPIPYPGMSDEDGETQWPPLIAVKSFVIRFSESDEKETEKVHRTKQEASELAWKLCHEIAKGADFDKIAKENSEKYNTKVIWIHKTDETRSDTFKEVAWQLGLGEMSQPFETENGYEIVIRLG